MELTTVTWGIDHRWISLEEARCQASVQVNHIMKCSVLTLRVTAGQEAQETIVGNSRTVTPASSVGKFSPDQRISRGISVPIQGNNRTNASTANVPSAYHRTFNGMFATSTTRKNPSNVLCVSDVSVNRQIWTGISRNTRLMTAAALSP